MAFSVDQFRASMRYDGARPNLFEVQLNFPDFVELGPLGRQASPFMVRSSQLPGTTLGIAPIQYFGREVKIAGNRTFPDWTVTIYNDEDFILRNAFERWHRGINENVDNVRDQRARNADGRGNTYVTDMMVYHYAKTGGSPLKAYKFVGAFPSDVSPIDLSWEDNDRIEDFTVTISYQYWTTIDQIPSTPGLGAINTSLNF